MRVSSCSSRRRRVTRALSLALALASAAAGATPSHAADVDPALRLRAVELEAELAKKPALYLVLDPAASELEVRVRGMALTEIPIVELSTLVFSGLFGTGEAPTLRAPQLWSISQGPGDTDRETIAPTTLRPYSEEEEESSTPSPAAASTAKKSADAEREPTSYRVQLDVGWQLLVTSERPQLDGLRRFGAAVRDGWLRLQGEEPSHPPLLAIVVSEEDAQRLHHLFRSGMPLLVLPGAD